ncbi:dual specificity protein kinase YAK1 homolog [Tasmannia lanceolata]|uniref:dual specificity protein kinase YAK1 homolog n=1 Tax=Tasmannia lanceolata TaxID=3420 RepID=UPI0040648DF4
MVEDHNLGGGHWFVAGLSPQVAKVSKGSLQNSPRFQMAPFSHTSSYGSLGSHGSYNDSVGLGGSYGSYGDSNMYMYYPSVCSSGLNSHSPGRASILGPSPDAMRNSQLPHGNGFGVSPSTGTFGPMSLRASPSQFTPPSSQIQVSASSPGKYGPSSPARGSVHGSPFGKGAAVGQYNRRRILGYPGTYERALSQHWQGGITLTVSTVVTLMGILEGTSSAHLEICSRLLIFQAGGSKGMDIPQGPPSHFAEEMFKKDQHKS